MSTTTQESVGFKFACCQCKVGNRFKNSTCETCQHKMCSSCTVFTPPEAPEPVISPFSATASCCKCKISRPIEINKCRVCGHNKCLLCPFTKSPPQTPPPRPLRRSRTPPKTLAPTRTPPPPPPFRLPPPAPKKPAPKKPSQSADRTGGSGFSP
jgi:hypothetical protein